MTHFVSLRFLTLPAGAEQRRDNLMAELRAAAEQIPGIMKSWVAPMREAPVIHAGHVVWRAIYQTENDALLAVQSPIWRTRIAPLLADMQITGVGYRTTRMAVNKQGPGIWRALVVKTFNTADPATVHALEDLLLLFPKYISTIRSWCLGQVLSAEGPKQFTHVWEQEFDSVEGLTGEYMDHPLHWGVVDGFFDAELPNYIIEGHVIQAVADIDDTIMQ